MKNLTKDEKTLLGGVILCAVVIAFAFYELYIAIAAPTLGGYVGTMIIGAMMFNGGVSGLTAICAIWYNYQATL